VPILFTIPCGCGSNCEGQFWFPVNKIPTTSTSKKAFKLRNIPSRESDRVVAGLFEQRSLLLLHAIRTSRFLCSTLLQDLVCIFSVTGSLSRAHRGYLQRFESVVLATRTLQSKCCYKTFSTPYINRMLLYAGPDIRFVK